MSDATDNNLPPEPEQPLPESGMSAWPYFLSLMLLVVMASAAWKWYQVRQFQQDGGQAMTATVGPPLSDFVLTERSGEPFRSLDMRGKVWVVTYFFTSCAGSCPRLNANVQRLNELPELEDVTWVSITVDPDNDTLEVLREYADRWEADPERWLFCRADLDYVKRIGLGMDLAIDRQGHSDRAVVIDKKGQIRGMYDATSKSQSQRLRTKLLECLEEPYPRELAGSGGRRTAG